MSEPYPIQPQATTPVSTRWRTIQSPIPHPDSVALLEQLRACEPACMEGQPPVVWDRAAGASVWDAWGNRWIDLTSGVLIANAGHGRPEIAAAITEAAQRPLLTTYCFPHHYRAELTALLRSVAPRPDDKVMLLSTGSEADELCLKLCREQARRRGVRDAVFVSFENAFHGRTLGSQRAGGIPSLQEWIGYPDPHFLAVPFPDGGVRSRPEDNDFAAFERTLAAHGVAPERVCGVISESYQGGNSSFAPPSYMQALRAWCDRYGVPLVLDEVQAGFGRTGTFWGYEHYNIIPDLISCGKGISGGLPLSAVIGRHELLDQFPPGSMTSTHSGNAVCCAAAAANVRLILNEQLTRRAAILGVMFQERAAAIQKRFGKVILAHHGKGLVASLHCVKPGTTEPDPHLAWQLVGAAVRAGVMLFAPVGFGGASVKLCPPLTIPEDALREALDALETVFANVVQA